MWLGNQRRGFLRGDFYSIDHGSGRISLNRDDQKLGSVAVAVGGTRKQKMVSKTHLGVGPSFCTKLVTSRFHHRRMYWPLTLLRTEGALAEVGVGRVNEESRSQRPGKFLDNAPECTWIKEGGWSLCLGIEPSFRASEVIESQGDMTGACTNQYTNRELILITPRWLLTLIRDWIDSMDRKRFRLLYFRFVVAEVWVMCNLAWRQDKFIVLNNREQKKLMFALQRL